MEVQQEEERLSKAQPPRAVREAREADAESLMQWMDAFGSDAPLRVQIIRVEPKHGPLGESIDGVLETIDDERPDEDYIARTWGGGKFQIKVSTRTAKGNWQYARAITIRVAGDPPGVPKHRGRLLSDIAPGGATSAHATAGDSDTIVERVMGATERVAEKERERADRLERELAELRSNAGRLDADVMQRLMAPLQAQVAELTRQNQELQIKLIEYASKPAPTDPFRDRVLEQAVSGESARITQMQTQYDQRLEKMRDDHATEIRLIREGHTQDLRRLEDRHDRAMDDLRKSSERQLDELRRAHERELKQAERAETSAQKTLELAHSTRVESLSAENKRLEAEIVELKSRIGSLEKIKEKPLVEQLTEIGKLKESLEGLTGGGGDDDTPTWQRALETVFNSEAVQTVVARVAGGDDDQDDGPPQQQPQQVQIALPPPGQFFQHPGDGQIYRHLGNGQIQGPVDQARLRQLAMARRKSRKAQSGAQQQAADQPADAGAPADDVVEAALADGELGTEPPAAPPQLAPAPRQRLQRMPVPGQPAAVANPVGQPVKQPPAEDIRKAVMFLESAFTGGTKPEQVVRAARSFLSVGTTNWVRAVGADQLIALIQQAKPESPLVSERGRDFVRSIAKSLMGG